MMKLDLFGRIIDGMKDFPRRVRVLHLYKDGEPLLHKSLPEMVARAKSAGVAESVETTTNGSLLTTEIAEALIEAGLDCIRISVYGLEDDGYRKITQTHSDFEKIRRNVASIYEMKERKNSPLRVHCKITDAGLTDVEKEAFIRDFGPLSDSFNIDSLMGWSNTLDKDMTLGLQPATGMSGVDRINPDRRVCPEPFMKMSINYNGKVSVCCVDWGMDTIVGDVSTQSLVEIWNGEALREFRLAHLRGARETIPACLGCHYVSGISADSDLDEPRYHLLGVYGDKWKNGAVGAID
jgi:MoaA/NifB/PqqE/SkfB family radical SAM enzyme